MHIEEFLRGWFGGAGTDVTAELIKEVSHLLANSVAPRLSAETKTKIRKNPQLAEKLLRASRVLLPNHSSNSRFMKEFVSDFATALVHAVTNGPAATGEASSPEIGKIAAAVVPAVTVLQIAADMDAQKREEFLRWYQKVLNQKRFHQLVAGQSEERIKVWCALSPAELDLLMRSAPRPTRPKKSAPQPSLKARVALSDEQIGQSGLASLVRRGRQHMERATGLGSPDKEIKKGGRQ
ncbi:MAG: hypothetical protein A3K06_01185 [Candidatus Doudnabacteria bacterium RIFCSPHIGHO2_01_52_17]|uniref:Uncharacterized protein n=1 Tax=Candidatus Doudnabacteria bacterium RIFCSPHIGHO2_01_52_17 TaxID=1817820 RepID=A0A1F5NAC1_9BACT|nr:MAG: hypothetical protein A3K06_01185 [Candidatus Doudnabacteria bacterium RIFCSPHIGHO2_01_52_17]